MHIKKYTTCIIELTVTTGRQRYLKTCTVYVVYTVAGGMFLSYA